MANKQSKMQPKIAIVAIIFLLLGIVIALSYILLNGGSVSTIKQEIVQKSQDKKKTKSSTQRKIIRISISIILLQVRSTDQRITIKIHSKIRILAHL